MHDHVPKRLLSVRTSLHRASVALLCGSLVGEQRRSAWITEQARLLGAPVGGSVPAAGRA